METAFISRLKPLLDAVAKTMDVYVPARVGDHYTRRTYDPGGTAEPEWNDVRMSPPVKELLFPFRELAAVFPEPTDPQSVKPFAVFGLKACDLRSMEILDKVFLEKDFEDPFYVARRTAMFTISSDCPAPAESCFCNVLSGKPYPEGGFDLNVSRVVDGFLLQSGSAKGRDFLFAHAGMFGEVPDDLLAERATLREAAQSRLEQITRGFRLDAPIGQIMERGYDSDVFDEQARTCVECQACTRICPTCHCFYLYDAKQQDYFAKMKMWDSCMRIGHAQVAGGANPRKMLGDRLRHRLMHKFAYFLDRYGLDMCVGCGRCIDAETGDVDIRVTLKRLNDEFRAEDRKTVKAAK
ncbi:MAG: 4Fe-4S dicluster domain-containing protein [Sedimentisphaerales bacterium]|nr:4Fe-4S dicluster domain-containing protein [Sedimentisphaerales bacterium]